MNNNFPPAPSQALPNQNFPSQQNLPSQQFPTQQFPAPQNFPPQGMSPSAPQTPSRDFTRELEEFRESYPELYAMVRYDSKCIPAPVWELISGQGMTMTRAFRVWLDQQQIQNQRNTQRSAGSMRSAGTPCSMR